mmetsp:Transcript_11282/g.15894  ORF Transcript_11282/g.15894 Transcript_11282/m.15894 type:complete len:503 (-) Transcript_11282:187-1695(-)
MNTPQQSNRRQQHAYDSLQEQQSSASKYGPSYGTSPTTMQTVTLDESGGIEKSTGPHGTSFTRRVMNSANYVGTPGLEYGEYSSPPTSRYGEINSRRNPFHNVRRRRKGDSVAIWTTRIVLASPLLILVLWSTALIFHSSTASSSQTQQQLQTTTMKQQATTRGMTTLGKTNHKNKGGHFVAAKPKPKPRPHKPKPKPKPKHRATDTNSNTVMIVQPASAQQETLDTSNNPIPIVVPLGESSQTAPKATATTVIMQPENLQGATTTETTPQEMTSTEQTANELGTTDEASQNQMATEEQEGNEVQSSITESEASALQLQTQQQQQATKVYYYDASVSIKDGNLHIPDVVYDASGNPVKLTDLNNGRAEIYLEPPTLTKSTETDASAMQQAETPSLGATQKQENEQKLSFSQNKKVLTVAQTEQRQDQMIIISTVAVMALLVGALSARRMRSRNFLSSCIENESLEDELAYDTAYTTRSEVASGAYHTFGPAPWKGDLEKFDV